jgi:hypothetical protein
MAWITTSKKPKIEETKKKAKLDLDLSTSNKSVASMEPVEGHYVTDEYVQVKNLIVTVVPPSMDFNGGATDLFDVASKKSVDASKSFNNLVMD